MFTHNVIAWGSRAGYDSEAEADVAARKIVREHGVRASVEVDRSGEILRTYAPGVDGEPVDVDPS